MILKNLLPILFILLLQEGMGQPVVLQGNAEQFAGEYLLIREIVNPITGDSKVIDTLTIENNGQFRKEISVSGAGWIFMNSGVYRIHMYVQSGFAYEILLPPKTTKSESDIRNPFFTPSIAHMLVLKEYPLANPEAELMGNDINTKILNFDRQVIAANNVLKDSRRNNISTDSDSLIRSIEVNYKNDTSGFFNNYRKYRYGIIKINSRDVGLEYLYENHLRSDVPQTGNPAYMELFNEMYEEFLFFYSRTTEGKSVNTLVNRSHNLTALKDTLMKHPSVPDEQLAELIIIKEIFDIYFKDYFYKEALLILLDSVIVDPVTESHAQYAMGVKNYLTRLKTGQNPPAFELLDRKNSLKTIDDFKGKYVYLNFCTPDNYSCLKEFPFLKTLHEVHGKYLEIVTVMVTEKQENMSDFMDKNKYNWTALFYGNKEKLLEDYDVRMFPTNYLLDPDGIIIQSPATLATEGFEQQLFRIMRSRGDL
ncbi:MAG: TlpA disulfide reductase family protein [Bacteroidales bacterium]